MYKIINDHTVKRRKVKRRKIALVNVNIMSKKFHNEGGEQIMKDFRVVYKKGGFSFALAGDYTKDKPENCRRWGRIDIPSISGYFYVLALLSYHRWFIHWEVEKCVYWEI